jgi:truncated hemoglobin YjbI
MARDESTQHLTSLDHDVWLKCFVGALARGTLNQGAATAIAQESAAIADAALALERSRRPERRRTPRRG